MWGSYVPINLYCAHIFCQYIIVIVGNIVDNIGSATENQELCANTAHLTHKTAYLFQNIKIYKYLN